MGEWTWIDIASVGFDRGGEMRTFGGNNRWCWFTLVDRDSGDLGEVGEVGQVEKRRRLDGVCGKAGKRKVESGGVDGERGSFERGVDEDRDRGETGGRVTRDLVC